MLLCLFALAGFGQTITGTVYRDFNSDGAYTRIPASGTYTYGEPGVGGVTVTAYDAAGTAVATTTSSSLAASLGSYTLTVGNSNAYRVEFTNLIAGNYESFRGAGNGTSVQFVYGGTNTVNLGINLPEDYCQSNPKMIIPCYENGSGVGNTNPVLVSINYSSTGSGLNTYPTNVNADRVGSTWGVAYDKRKKLTYISAFLKRQAGLGDRGLDGIYVVDNSTATPALIGGFDLEGVTPSNGGNPMSFGSVTRTLLASGSGTSANDLSADRTQASRDENAYAKVGKVGYGDIDIDQTSKTLWAVNLNERSLVAIDISSTLQSSAIPNALASAKVKRYFIDGTTTPFITGLPGCPSGTMRPFGLKIHNNKGYLGVVCDGSALTTVDMTANQLAYVLSFDTTDPTAFTQVTSVPLNYSREMGWVPFTPAPTFDALESDKWQRWIDTYTDPTSFGSTVVSTNADFKTGINGSFVGAPQPILADIEFLPNGDMVLGFMDRFAHQQGWANYVPGSSTTLRSAVSQGDVLLASWNGSTFSFEGPNENDNLTNPPVAVNAQAAQSLTDGPSGSGEFFYQDYYIGSDATHPETALGGLAVLPGSNELTAVSFDPTAFFAMGVRWLNASAGNQSRTYTIVANTNIASFGKGSALGDVELLCNLAPVEIGNRVWIDTNNNGVQDASESGLGGVQVTLSGPGLTSPVSVTTSPTGEYYFSSGSGTAAVGFAYSLTGLTGGGSYSLTFPTSASAGTLVLSTKPNAATGINTDLIDTDPNSTGVIRFTLGEYGQNNFSYDAGYVPTASLGDFVFEDTNKDGLQDGNELPIPGVVVTLYTNGVASLTTTTNASGLYSFTGLTPGSSFSYAVGFTTPGGYTVTTPLSGTDKTIDSDPVNGLTTSITLASGENNPTLDAGFYLLPARLGDFVFVDGNRNGIQDGNEPGIPGVVATLYVNGVMSQTTTTDASGLYSFTGLTPGSLLTYAVGFTTPNGYTITLQNAGGDETNDSNTDPITGKTQSLTLAPDEFNQTVDAGFYIPSAGLGDLVFSDTNRNGIQDKGESGIAGVIVTLFTNGVASLTTTTNETGFYSFTGLTPGSSQNYAVGFSAPSSYSATLQNGGLDDANDSDADLATGKTQSVILVADEFNSTLDAGFFLPETIQLLVGTPVCNTLTNRYTATATVSTSNVVTSSFTVTDNGTTIETILLTAGQTTASFSLTGLSDASSHTVVVTLTGGTSASAVYSAPLACTACSTSLTTVSLPNGQIGTAYSQTLTATGGIAPYTYALLGRLPIGLSLDASTGVISGTPTSATTASFTLVVSDRLSCSDTQPLTLTMAPLPVCSLAATAIPGDCNTATNQYTLTGIISATNASVNSASPQTLTVSVGSVNTTVSLTGGGPVSYTLTGLTSDGLTKSVSVLSSATACGATSVVFTAPASCTVAPKLTLEKMVSLSKAKLGDILTYTIVLTNVGTTTANNVIVMDSSTVGLAYMAGSATAPVGTTFTQGSPSSTWRVGSLNAAQSLSLTFQARADSSGILYNKATIPGDTATVCTTIPVRVCAGEDYTFQLSVAPGRASYRWYRDGVEIVGQTTNILEVSTPGSYSLSVDNVTGKCPDFSCCPFIIEEDTLPTFQAVATPVTCVGNSLQTNGKIVLRGFTPTQTYQYSAGNTFNQAASLSGVAKTIPANGVIVSTLTNPTVAQAYTVRVYNRSGCYKDVTVGLLPTVCDCPADVCAPFVLKQTKRAKRIGDPR